MQKVLYAIGGLFVALIVIGLALPRLAVVSVSERIDAYSATVFALVNDPDRMALWAPWLDADPNARVVLSGPDRGIDAAMTWDGPIIGIGSQVIRKSEPFSHVEFAINPGETGNARAWFDLEDVNGATVVSWSFETDHGFNLVGRYFAPLLSGIVRRDYERDSRIFASLPRPCPTSTSGTWRSSACSSMRCRSPTCRPRRALSRRPFRKRWAMPISKS